MIVLLSDFGLEGPYVGQIHAVLYRQALGIPVLNLFADLPAFNPKAAAYLLPAYIDEFPKKTVFLAVVDPGVGTERRPIILDADGKWFVGPDNGLFAIVARRATHVRRWRITFNPQRLSASFHGRDVFAPVAAELALGQPPDGSPCQIDDSIFESWPDDLLEVVYLDHFGNAVTGYRASNLSKHAALTVANVELHFSRTFGEAIFGIPFWYENSNGLIEVSMRENNVAKVLGLTVGTELKRVRQPHRV